MTSTRSFFNIFFLIGGLISSFIKLIATKVSFKTDSQEAKKFKDFKRSKVGDLEKGVESLTRKDLEDFIFGSDATIFRSASNIKVEEEKYEISRISSEEGTAEKSSQPVVRTFSCLPQCTISQIIHSERFKEIENDSSQDFKLFKKSEEGFNERNFAADLMMIEVIPSDLKIKENVSKLVFRKTIIKLNNMGFSFFFFLFFFYRKQ
ncbi:hypothetical protein BY996DRAFT_1430366 [Phakopsora pachyrhizi]|nr:hypothetical protein BY996DRAFT_1430366 [Phakopsora pachyrhizi]